MFGKFWKVLFLLVTLCAVACGSAPEEMPHYTIGLITNSGNGLRNVQGFRDGMAELGYVEGENTTFLFADAPTSGDQLETAIQAFVDAEVDLIFTAGTPTGRAAYNVTQDTETPVVFGVIADPVAAGVLTDLDKPGGNMTGVRLSDNQGRRLELFVEMVPSIKRIYVPYNPDDASPMSAILQIREVAPRLGVELVEVPVNV